MPLSPHVGHAPGSICDVPRIVVGHATNLDAATGCTVVLCAGGAVGGVDVRGGAPGTRETDLLRPDSTVERVHGVILAGGSAFGLAAADGVMAHLEARGEGYQTRAGVVPIVPSAVIYDLGIGRADVRPDAAMGRAACDAATADRPAEGTVGAGTGATVAKLAGAERPIKGGVGTASRRVGDHVIGALVVLNAVGEVYGPDGEVLAGCRSSEALPSPVDAPRAGENTTIGVVATDLPLDAAGVTRLAQVAQDGLALAVRPAHTSFDGDTFFALSTAPALSGTDRVWPIPLEVTAAVADVVAESIRRAVLLASGLHGIPAVSDQARLG
ncbi:MAG: P1 family peptidase [Chloroflexi bacterium]|nr:P1 family peptidase [Chloroflexota bacterium]